jgi:hypothetical protein
VLAQLAVEKERAGAGRGAYVLGAKQDLPGSFYLAFITNTKPHKEFMVVTPDGIYFRHEVGVQAMRHTIHPCSSSGSYI